MRSLAVLSILPFSNLNRHKYKILQKEEVMWKWRGMKFWMLFQNLFYPMHNISRKRNFLLMFFTNPLGIARVKAGKRIRMASNPPPINIT